MFSQTKIDAMIFALDIVMKLTLGSGRLGYVLRISTATLLTIYSFLSPSSCGSEAQTRSCGKCPLEELTYQADTPFKRTALKGWT